MKNLCYIALVVLIVSCSTGNQNSYVCENVKYITEFQKEIELPLKNPEKICLNGCLDIFNVDSLLICKMQGGDYFWKVYNLNNNGFLGSLLRKGHAENEFIEMPVSEKSVVTDSALYCDFWNYYAKEWISCNLTASLAKKSLVCTSKRKVRSEDEFHKLFMLSDSSFFGMRNNHSFGNVRGILHEGNFEELNNIGNLNTLTAKQDLNLLSANLCVNTQREMVAEAMLRLNQINLYSLRNTESVTLCMDENLQDVVDVESMPEKLRKKYFGSIRAYKDYFVALYYDSKLVDFFTGNSKSTYLLFFGWNGLPLQKIKVQFLVTNFFIYNNQLYLFSTQEEKEMLYKYDL